MKKIILLIFSLLSLLSITACKKCNDKDSVVKLSVWGAVEHHSTLNKMIKSFKEKYENENLKFEISIEAVSEADAFQQMQKDVTNGADVYAFVHDQLANLVRIGGLAAIGGDNLTQIKNDNTEQSLFACKAGEYYYAYPFAADNGYFLYYDKSKISSEEAKSLESILLACDKSNSKFLYDLDNSWYDASFFFATGCTYEVEYDEKGTTEVSVKCDFNSSNGVLAGKAMLKLANNKSFLNGGDDELKAGFADGSISAGVSGTWNALAVKNALKENYAATKLPTFTIENKTYQMSSFAGYKLMGVNPHSKNLVWAHKLASWLTNEENQLSTSEDVRFFRLNKIFKLRTVIYRTDNFNKKDFDNAKDRINKKANKELNISQWVDRTEAGKMMRFNIIHTDILNDALYQFISQNASRSLTRVEGIINIAIVGNQIMIPPLYGECDLAEISRYKGVIKFINQVLLNN